MPKYVTEVTDLVVASVGAPCSLAICRSHTGDDVAWYSGLTVEDPYVVPGSGVDVCHTGIADVSGAVSVVT